MYTITVHTEICPGVVERDQMLGDVGGAQQVGPIRDAVLRDDLRSRQESMSSRVGNVSCRLVSEWRVGVGLHTHPRCRSQ